MHIDFLFTLQFKFYSTYFTMRKWLLTYHSTVLKGLIFLTPCNLHFLTIFRVAHLNYILMLVKCLTNLKQIIVLNFIELYEKSIEGVWNSNSNLFQLIQLNINIKHKHCKSLWDIIVLPSASNSGQYYHPVNNNK